MPHISLVLFFFSLPHQLTRYLPPYLGWVGILFVDPSTVYHALYLTGHVPTLFEQGDGIYPDEEDERKEKE